MSNTRPKRQRQCPSCGTAFTSPRANHNVKFCQSCKDSRPWRHGPLPRPRTCVGCDSQFMRPVGNKRKYCTACVDAQAWVTPTVRDPERGWRTCAICNAERHVGPKGLPNGQYICHACRRSDVEHQARLRAKRAASQVPSEPRRRARHFDVEYEPIDKRRVFARDKWRCGICAKSVDKRLAYPNPLSASLDHVVPMSTGGGHIYANVQCSHLACNVRKGARSGGEQLALIG